MYVEDPTDEMMNGYSDWEYYSDDYYDDDASLLNKRQQGSPVPRDTAKKAKNSLQRGRKRKLAATSEIPDLSLNDDSTSEPRSMGPWFKGTVWKSASPEKEEKKLYQPGMGERVALLDNWREVFKVRHPLGYHGGKNHWRGQGSSHKDICTRSAWVEKKPGGTVGRNRSQEGLEVLEEEEEEEGSRRRKRPRISEAKDLKSRPRAEVVVEGPVSRASRGKKSGQENGKRIEEKVESGRKRKAEAGSDEEENEEASRLRSKRVGLRKGVSKSNEDKKGRGLASGRVTRSKK